VKVNNVLMEVEAIRAFRPQFLLRTPRKHNKSNASGDGVRGGSVRPTALGFLENAAH
jgi:hypothetical protein